MADRLRPLWDFDDLDATEERLREQLDAESPTSDGRAEVLTQLARVEGLRGEFERGRRPGSTTPELGRTAQRRVRASTSSGGGSDGRAETEKQRVPALRVRVRGRAVGGQQYFMAADAAHMVALAASDRDEFLEWTKRGIELAEEPRGGVVLARPAPQQPRLGALRGRASTRSHSTRSSARCTRASASPRTGGDRDRALRRREDAPCSRTCGRGDPVARDGRRVGRARRQVRTAGSTRSSPRSTQPPVGSTTPVGRRGWRSRCSNATTPRSRTTRSAGCGSPPSPKSPRAGCSRACAGARARASRAPSRAPRRARVASAAAG